MMEFMTNTFEGWVLLGLTMITICSVILVFVVGLYLEAILEEVKQHTKEEGD